MRTSSVIDRISMHCIEMARFCQVHNPFESLECMRTFSRCSCCISMSCTLYQTEKGHMKVVRAPLHRGGFSGIPYCLPANCSILTYCNGRLNTTLPDFAILRARPMLAYIRLAMATRWLAELRGLDPKTIASVEHIQLAEVCN